MHESTIRSESIGFDIVTSPLGCVDYDLLISDYETHWMDHIPEPDLSGLE